MKEKKSLQEIIYVVFLLIAIVILFHWYTAQNKIRIEDQNKNYAADSAWQTAVKINEESDGAYGPTADAQGFGKKFNV